MKKKVTLFQILSLHHQKKVKQKSDTFFYSRTFFLALLHQQKKVWTEEKSEEEKVNQKNLKKCGTFFFTFFHSLCNNSNKKCSKKVSLFPQSSLHFFFVDVILALFYMANFGKNHISRSRIHCVFETKNRFSYS